MFLISSCHITSTEFRSSVYHKTAAAATITTTAQIQLPFLILPLSPLLLLLTLAKRLLLLLLRTTQPLSMHFLLLTSVYDLHSHTQQCWGCTCHFSFRMFFVQSVILLLLFFASYKQKVVPSTLCRYLVSAAIPQITIWC